MNKFIALILILNTTSALAFGLETPWEKIFTTKQLLLFFEENLGGIELQNACLTNSEIQTIKSMRHCPELVPVKRQAANGELSEQTDWVCKQWVVGPYSYPRTTATDTCTEFTNENDNLVCKTWGQKLVTVNKTINVMVAKSYGSNTTWPGFQKQYTFPDCK